MKIRKKEIKIVELEEKEMNNSFMIRAEGGG